MQTTFKVPQYRLDELAERLDSLNRRAKKLGLTPSVAMQLVGEPYVHRYPRTEAEAHSETSTQWTGAVTLQDVTVTGEAPKLAGWTLVSAIDHQEAVGDIVKSILGRDIPTEYRTRGPVCDHCGHKRKRNLTFVCQHDSGEWKQIGSTCLEDFTGGANPEEIARLCRWLGDLQAFGADLEDLGAFGCRVKPEFFLSEILRAGAAAVRVQGFYVSRKKSQEAADAGQDLVPTSSRVHQILSARTEEELKEACGGFIDQDKEISAKTLDFVRGGGIQGDGDYAYNINLLFKGETVGPRNVGLVASAVASYLRTQARIAAEKAQGSEHIGTVGERGGFKLTVISCMVRDGDFGASTIVRFKDQAGNPAVWFASGVINLKEGHTQLYKATVKKHDLYKGKVSTILARVGELSQKDRIKMIQAEYLRETGQKLTAKEAEINLDRRDETEREVTLGVGVEV